MGGGWWTVDGGRWMVDDFNLQPSTLNSQPSTINPQPNLYGTSFLGTFAQIFKIRFKNERGVFQS